MNKKIQKFIIFLPLIIGGTFLITPISFAQTFSNIIPIEAQEEVDILSDEEIESILNTQNIIDENNLMIAASETESQYTLGANDVLDISVLRHPEVSGQFVINNEGKIQYEFIGDVDVSGKTKGGVSELLKEILSKYIISPEVTVKIIGYNSKIVYVVGEVSRPGKIFMQGDTITIREALVRAGLPLLSAKTNKSKLITPADDGQAKQINVNIHKLLYKGDLRENLVMNPGDTLYIPPTLMTKTMRVLQPIAAPIGTASGTGRTLTTGF